jgi:predicted RNA binding protein YcfA (HicA-like mRNA interferase family)
VKFKELEKRIKAVGWHLDRVEGSHHHYEHPKKPDLISIPRHTGDMKPWIVHSVLKKAGLK